MARLIRRHALNLGNGRLGDQAGPLFFLGSILTAVGLMAFTLLWAGSGTPGPKSVDFAFLMIFSGAMTLSGLVLVVMAYCFNRAPTLFEELELYQDPVSATLRHYQVWFAGPKKSKPRKVLYERRFSREEIVCVGYDLLSIGGDVSCYYHRVVLSLRGVGRKVIGEYYENQKAEAKRLMERIVKATELPQHVATAEVYASTKAHYNVEAYQKAWLLTPRDSFDIASFIRTQRTHVVVLIIGLLTVALVLYLIYG